MAINNAKSLKGKDQHNNVKRVIAEAVGTTYVLYHYKLNQASGSTSAASKKQLTQNPIKSSGSGSSLEMLACFYSAKKLSSIFNFAEKRSEIGTWIRNSVTTILTTWLVSNPHTGIKEHCFLRKINDEMDNDPFDALLLKNGSARDPAKTGR